MLIRFLHDFRGVETREQFFEAGEEWDAPDELAVWLIRDGRAVEYTPETAPLSGAKRQAKPETKPETKSKQKPEKA